MRLLALVMLAGLAAAALASDGPPDISTCKALVAQLGVDVKGATVFCPTNEGFEDFAKEMGFKKSKKEKKREEKSEKKSEEKSEEKEEEAAAPAAAAAAAPTPPAGLGKLGALLPHLSGAAAPPAAPAPEPAFTRYLALLFGGWQTVGAVPAPSAVSAAAAATAAATPAAEGGDPVARMVAAVPQEDLKLVLQFHVVPGKVLPASAFKDGETVVGTLVPKADLTVVKKKGKLSKVVHDGRDVDDEDDPDDKEDEDIEGSDLTFEGPYEAGSSAYVVHAIEEVMVPLAALDKMRAARKAALGNRRLMMLR